MKTSTDQMVSGRRRRNSSANRAWVLYARKRKQDNRNRYNTVGRQQAALEETRRTIELQRWQPKPAAPTTVEEDHTIITIIGLQRELRAAMNYRSFRDWLSPEDQRLVTLMSTQVPTPDKRSSWIDIAHRLISDMDP